jgi:hypothetical protein
MRLNAKAQVRLENLHRRLEAWLPEPLQPLPLPKKLLLIRPTVRRDPFARQSHRWASQVKDRALALGWDVEDLEGANATRANVEASLGSVVVHRPGLVMHYDHGSEYTLYGHAAARPRLVIDAFVPAIDERNVEMTAGMFVSAAACLSAAGLGPLAVRSRARGYLGYSDLLVSSLWIPERFGDAVNAPNYALLEGKSPAEAFDQGWQAWDRLASQLRAEGAAWDAACAEWNRDVLTLLPT